ncbi:helix-hairpin-helix domain-containing protein [bacterium]|nr:helix-hairpin-helix domain-containing protein [bacterium]
MRKLLTALFFALALFAPTSLWQPTAQAKPSASEKIAIVDINTADEATLRTVPGIGEVYSKKIIQGRPYRAKDELWRKNILPKGVYDKVKEYLIAKQSK